MGTGSKMQMDNKVYYTHFRTALQVEMSERLGKYQSLPLGSPLEVVKATHIGLGEDRSFILK